MAISRREFLESAAALSLTAQSALGAAVDSKTGMPTRILGKTGARVSVLAFGCGSRFLMYKEEDEAIAALTKALDLGITYIDTAFSYGNGKSEERVGKLMPARRKQVWLATKVQARKGDDAMRIVEGSLKRLQTDHLDLLHIHALLEADDLAAIEAKDGVLQAVYKLRDQKVARHIGITCHQNPQMLKLALERHDFDCTQMALNAARAGMVTVDRKMAMGKPNLHDSFETIALPVALKKKMGVIGMKVFGQEKLVGEVPVEKLIQYTLSLPVSACTAGMPKLEFIEENIKIAKAFKQMSPGEMKSLSDEVASKNKMALDRFFHNHIDA
jgi:predicted aldo/keto reductase-like oxidoreductase